jgi:hypothetical protein
VTFNLAAPTDVTFTVSGVVAGQSRFQCESGFTPTSFIETAAAAVTRNAERLSTPLPNANIIDMTFYASIYEPGNAGFGNQSIFHAGLSTATNPYWRVESAPSPDRLRGRMTEAGGTQQTTPDNGAGVLFTTHIEVLAKINVATGRHYLQVVRNGVVDAEVQSFNSFTMPATFAGSVFHIGGQDNGGSYPMAIDSLQLVAGHPTLETMRAIAVPVAFFEATLQPESDYLPTEIDDL